MNPFQELALDVSYDIAPQALEGAYFKLQRLWHPDRFAHASLDERKKASQKSSQINEAYRLLKDPVKRAEAILRSQGIEHPCQPVAPSITHEAFEWRERLQEQNTPEGLMALQAEGQKKYQIYCQKFSQVWGGHPNLIEAQTIFQTMAFYAKFIRSCEDMLISQSSPLD